MKPVISKKNSKPLFLYVFILVLLFGIAEISLLDNVFVGKAQAVVGRPATPHSAAGVARRTTRRHVHRRRHVVVLPSGCTTVIRHNVTYSLCGGVWYEPYYKGDELVYIIVDEP